MTGTQHHADARAELAARLVRTPIVMPDASSTFAAVHQFAADFIRWLDDNGWAPYEIREPRQQHTKPADPEKVHDIITRFKAEQEARQETEGEPA